MELRVAADEENLARLAAELISTAARVAGSDGLRLALSGGSTPRRMLEILGAEAIDWSRVGLFQVDERVAPVGSADRNLTMLEETLPIAEVTAMPVDAVDLEAAAAAYADDLPDHLDLVVLGLGDDGHTASLVPDDPVLAVTDRDVATTGPYRGRRRMTLTYPALERATSIVWLVSGADKQDSLARLLAGDPDIPAGLVSRRQAVVLADQPAVGP